VAQQPASLSALIEAFGPHLAFAAGSRLDRGIEPDRLVKTHCCFCGQQCGIQLKVKDNEVIGFEPWEEFPFNRGMLCPKGVKRYLQGSHPDRLLHAYRQDSSSPSGFRQVDYDEAVRLVAESLLRIQSQHGDSSVAVLSGASLTTEKTYLMGKFARMCLKTANIDYNGRLCMVSAGAGNKKAFGIDRAANPWSDIPKAEVVWISGANVAECAPITTSYVWEAREFGAKVIVVDPRITPIARTCDLFLPVKPGRDVALFNGILNLMIEHDWLDHAFIERHTNGFDPLAEHVRQWTPKRTAEVTGIAEKTIRQAAEWWGMAKTSFLLHARGIEHHSHGVQNVLGAINMVLASGRIGREGCGYATSTGRSAINFREAATWRILSTGRTSHACGASSPMICRPRASMPWKFSTGSTGARFAACSRFALIRSCHCQTTTLSPECWKSSTSTWPSTSFLMRRRDTPISCCPARSKRRMKERLRRSKGG
jgi:assimilatory nitrate reductase catalytic subunit